MKKTFHILILLLIASSLAVAQSYVGPEKCLTCHGPMVKDQSGWRASMHANGYTVVLDDTHSMEDLYGMVNDYDGNGIDDFKDGLNFNNIDSKFDQYKPNAPILAYSAENGYTITMGDVTHKVYMTYGGSGLYKQRYMMKVETSEGYSNGYYVSPIQYNEKTSEYVVYHGSDWYKEDNTPKYTSASTLSDIANNSRNIAKNCSGCHSNGLEVWQDSNNEWLMKGAPMLDDAAYTGMVNVFDIDEDGNLDQINTTCERCHGPGGDHAGSPSAENIINPKNLTADEANNLCGMCHARGKSLPNNTFGFPFHDDTLVGWEVGDMVADIYTDGGGDWGDNVTSKSHHQQFFDLYESSKPTFMYHQVTCYECHDVHNEVLHHIRAELEEEDSTGAPITVATSADDNTLCLACHATHGAFSEISVEMVADFETNAEAIGDIVSAHSRHGKATCISCHMAKTSKSAIAYDVHGHTFEVIPPQKTKEFNMPNSCAVSCHGNANAPGGDFGVGIIADDLTAWDGTAQQALADTLLAYYGPEGKWWQHVVSVEKTIAEIPVNFDLGQNYPNPFNPTTTINFSVPNKSSVKLMIFDAVGQLVAELVNDVVPAGSYKVSWNAIDLTSGIYFYTMQADNFVQSKKMI
ncbi:MAG: T9SS type A sorting domain-containing protein, partial [Bacteroidota bacterium]